MLPAFLRRRVLLLLCIFIPFSASANICISENLELSGLNEVQKEIIVEESEKYAASIAELYKTDQSEYKRKVFEMLYKLRDGLRVYKIARDPNLQSRIDSFETTYNTKVQLITYVDDSFLNNLFYRLAEAFYETTKPYSYIRLTYKFSKSNKYTTQKPLFFPKEVTAEMSEFLRGKISKDISILNATARKPLHAKQEYELFDDKNLEADYFKSVDEVLNWLIGDGISNFRKHVNFLDPAGHAFTVLAGGDFLILSAIKNGPVLSFDFNGTAYQANIIGNVFKGYIDKSGNAYQYSDKEEGYLYYISGFKDNSRANFPATICYLPSFYDPEEKSFKSIDEGKVYASFPETYSSTSNPQPVNLKSLVQDLGDCRTDSKFPADVSFKGNKIIEERIAFGGQSVSVLIVSHTSDRISLLEKKYSTEKPIAGVTATIIENGHKVTYDKAQSKWKAEPVNEQELKQLRAKIEDGDFETETEVLFETQTLNGRTTSSATLGYRNDLKPSRPGFIFDDGTRRRTQSQQNKKINTYLYKEDVTDLTKVMPKVSSNAFPDGKETVIKECSPLEKVLKIAKESSSFIKNCKIPERMYDPKAAGYNDCLINTSPYFSGVGNGIIDEVTSIPQLILLATDIALDENVRNGLVESFKNLTLEQIEQGIVNSGQTLLFKTDAPSYHARGTFTVTVASMVLTGGLTKGAKSILKETDDAMAENVDVVAKKMEEAIPKPIKITDEVFGGARQRAISKYRKDAEFLIYTKFKDHGGAAAEIIDFYDEIGLEALMKVDNIQDAAKLLIKGKSMYRYLNETSFNFEIIKSKGIIDAAPNAWPTYITLQKISDNTKAKSLFQLPKKPTWIAEFDSEQILDDVRIPYAKGESSNYLEVLTRSYPNLGDGGGSQFITNKRIKLKRLINFETGEVINF